MYARSTIRRNLGYLRGRGEWKRYSEVVTARRGHGRYTIYLRREDGLGQPPAPVSTGMVAAKTASAAGAGFAAGGPIGAAVAAVAALITGLWTAHKARVAGAKDENACVASAVQAFDQTLQAIFQALNSGQLGPNDAITQLEAVQGYFWQGCAPYTKGAGEADNSNMGTNCAQAKCDKSCTVTCCVWCNDLAPGVGNCISVVQAGGGTAQIPTVYSSKYGLPGRSGYSLTYTPSALGSVAGSSLGSLASGSSSSLLVLALVGIGAFALARR